MGDGDRWQRILRDITGILNPLSTEYGVRLIVMHDVELEQLQKLIAEARLRLEKKRD